MIPILFSADATAWASFGIGVLSNAISCVVEENRNGAFELELEYPITGAYFDDIQLRRIIVAKPNYTDNPQPFRIYNISKPLNGVITINAQHISYDLSGYVDAPFTAAGIQAALVAMKNSQTIYPTSCPFTFTSDMSGSQTMTVRHPESVRALMGGVEGSLLDIYGGEWHFNGFTCTLNAARGSNRGIVIRYGKNLIDLRQEENNASVYTGVYPYYYDRDTETLVTLTEKVITVSGTFGYTRILPLDLTADFDGAPSEASLRARANSYISTNNIGVPKVNLTIDFVQSSTMQSRVDLCDTVTVQFDDLGVSATAKCIRTKWDVLRGRYIEAELGSARNSLAATIAKTKEIKKEIQDQTSQFQYVAKSIADVVTGNSGGYIVLHDTNNDGEPDEILIMDSADITQAVNVIRMNNSGIAFSSTGYNGTYTTAWNINGGFVADFIASGTLATNNVTILGDTQFSWDAANIEIVNPNDTDQIIRFGKYDGTNYGLGFSHDGGTTWKSGIDFSGMKLNDIDTNARAEIDGDSFDIYDGTSLSLTHIGVGTVYDENDDVVQGAYYRLGTFAKSSQSEVFWHGIYSFSAGRVNHPRGAYCVCIGYRNKADGLCSVAIGKDAQALGRASIAIGEQSICDSGIMRAIAIGAGCNAKAVASTAIGYNSTASGEGAFAAGLHNTAVGDCSFASGYQSETNAAYSVAMGYQCETTEQRSVAFGLMNTTLRQGQLVSGDYADTSSTDLLVIGNGTADDARSNALRLWYTGDLVIAGNYLHGSDRRLKDIVGEVPDLSAIRAVRYKWNNVKPNHDEREHIGYIAQDVEEIEPCLVVTDNKGYKTLDYIGLLCAKVELLERTVATLIERVRELEQAR